MYGVVHYLKENGLEKRVVILHMTWNFKVD